MPRPRRLRRVRCLPGVNYFKPVGITMAGLKENILAVDEFEALRLKDLLNLDQAEAAKKMKISQPTFHRLILSARKKVADSLVEGKAIKIEGGMYKMVQPRGRGFGRGAGGRMGGPLAAGPIGECVCPKCGQRAVHQRGVPCYQQKCPKCGSLMVRG